MHHDRQKVAEEEKVLDEARRRSNRRNNIVAAILVVPVLFLLAAYFFGVNELVAYVEDQRSRGASFWAILSILIAGSWLILCLLIKLFLVRDAVSITWQKVKDATKDDA